MLLVDGNPFADDGAFSYLMKQRGEGDKKYTEMIPQYLGDGPTPRDEQYAPKKTAGEFAQHIASTVVFRGKNLSSRALATPSERADA